MTMTTPAAERPAGGAPYRRGRPPLRAVPAGQPTERDRQRRFFETFLRATTNNRGRPYNERSIGAYRDGVVSLDKYLAEVSFTGGFEAIEVETLNDYFRDYRLRHSQGGTVTKQRNLAVFFAWLAAEYETANPYDGKALARYRRDDDGAPPVLSDALIAALLKVTSGRDYESLRDHAIIRLFLTGMRREQMARLRVEDVDLDGRVLRIAGLKGHPDHYIGIGSKPALALNRWLRVRASNPHAQSASAGWLWLGSRKRSAMTSSGLYQMLRRRAVQAGYERSAVWPHLFRHTRAHLHLENNGQEGDLMRHMGWRDRSMVDRYARGLAEQRAIEDAHRRGLDDRF